MYSAFRRDSAIKVIANVDNFALSKMSTALWIMQGILAPWFVMPAIMKLTASKEKMIEKGQLEPNGSELPIRVLGFLELLGIVGIIVTWLTGILPIVTPIAAVAFGMIMLSAFAVHIKEGV